MPKETCTIWSRDLEVIVVKTEQVCLFLSELGILAMFFMLEGFPHPVCRKHSLLEFLVSRHPPIYTFRFS